MVQNKRWIYKQLPEGVPKDGQDFAVETEDFDIDQNAPEGGLIAKVLFFSLDPYLRGNMRPQSQKSYAPAFRPGHPIQNFAVVEVLKSDSEKAQKGDHVVVYTDAAEYAVVHKPYLDNAATYLIPKDRDDKIKLSYYVGILGMPGRTAWSSIHEIGQPKKGETIWISAASGPVGSIVGQIAKHKGLTVIGSVGSKEKLDYVTNDLGFNEAFNYKDEKPADAIKRLAPNGLDIYFDNVGGDHLEAAINASNPFARLIECGQISEYSTPMEKRYPIRNLGLVVSRRLRMQGFIVSDPGFGDKYFQEHIDGISKWVADGTFKAREHVTDGIDGISQAFLDMLSGKNEGKAVIKVAKDVGISIFGN